MVAFRIEDAYVGALADRLGIIPRDIPKTYSKQYDRYEVETIRDHRVFYKRKKLEFLVKWKDYPESDNTWEPFSMFS